MSTLLSWPGLCWVWVLETKSLFGETSCDCKSVFDETAEFFELVAGERGFELAWVGVWAERLECGWDSGCWGSEYRLDRKSWLECLLWVGDIMVLMGLTFASWSSAGDFECSP